MKKNILLIVILIILFSACSGKQENEKSEIGAVTNNEVSVSDENIIPFCIYGEDFMVTVPLDKKWMVDMDFAGAHRVNGFWYIKELGLEKTPVVIFMELSPKQEEDKSINNYINWDKKWLLENYPSSEWGKSEESVKSKNGFEIQLFHFKSGNGHFQMIAYLECNRKYYVKLYLDSLNEEDFEFYKEDLISGVANLDYLDIGLEMSSE